MTRPQVVPSPGSARVCVIAAAVLWSCGSVFVRVLGQPTPLGLDAPALTPVQIAFYRGLFAGLVLVPLVRRRDVRFRPALVGMVGCFGVMSGLYLSALGLGPAANAILLQNTAPMWVCLIGAATLGAPVGRRLWQAVLLGLAGAVTIVAGNWPSGLPPEEQTRQVQVMLMGLGSGVAYAGVVLMFGALRHESGVWLSLLNLIGSAAVLGAFLAVRGLISGAGDWFGRPTAGQLAFVAVFGAVQMAVPYLLFARGVRGLGPQEAGVLTLLEPILNPVWAYLLNPGTDTPTPWTFAGGGVLLLGLVWRYVPRGKRQAGKAHP